MTTPPSVGSQHPEHEPVSLDKPEAEEPFDPYRFGAPEHPVPPEYAPPGYRPPPPIGPQSGQEQLPAGAPGTPYPGYPGYPPTYSGYPGYQGPPGYGPPGYGPPPPWMAQYPPPRTGNGKAVAALILGVVSILMCWLSIFDAIPILLAFILGGIAISDSQRTGSGRAMAIWGVCLAGVGLVLAIAITVWAYPKVRDCLDSYDQNSSQFNNCIRQKF
jgi:hypothetical protein